MRACSRKERCGAQGYHDADLPAVLDRAWVAGVTRIIITATNAAEAKQALALARTDGVSAPFLDKLCEQLRAQLLRSSSVQQESCSSPKVLTCLRAAERLFCTVGVHPTRCGEFDEHPGGPDAYMADLMRIMEDGQSDGKACRSTWL